LTVARPDEDPAAPTSPGTTSQEVVNLELDGPLGCWRKIFLHGFHRRRNDEILASLPLSMAERIEIFRSVVRRRNDTATRAAVLPGALVVGALCWQAGWILGPLLPGERSAAPRPTSGPTASPGSPASRGA